ncbi:hypothetical protein [Streptomyces sp. NPDC058045]|uniref:hypothetical protein n=1 Tax=Streptomyces sp. NPDC058045 TaxID=3346311 RepID=UPI0036E69F60
MSGGGVGDCVIPVILSLIFALVALLVWADTLWEWENLMSPPQPHDPARYFTRRESSWRDGPESLHSWAGSSPMPDGRDRGPVRVARIEAVLDGESSDEGGGVPTRLRISTPDGDTSLIHLDVSDVRNVRPGMFLPVRHEPDDNSPEQGGTWDRAWELDGPAVGRVLLDHRHRLGLVDDEAHRVLRERLTETPESAEVRAIRPTGAVRHGHVEVRLNVMVGELAATVRGFLRPEDVATVRHTGRVPVTRSARGGWLLWPTWY